MMIATGSGTEEEQKLSAMADRFCRRFSLAEIQLATQNFSEEHVIGIGGFGKVYVAQIDNGEESVAIKRLATNSNQGAQEFVTEIETLSKLRHINLVSLIGYCNENGEMILVYEYISGGTLADNLYKLSRSSDCQSLTWKQRLSICTGAARGLDYLHSGISIIHRDVKSTNILLDENFRAKVSDFGLAKHLSTINPKSHVSTIVKGSFGYIDPSYFTTCRLTRQSDTYAFGVVLLEVLCGRPAVDPRLGEDEMSLVMWAQEKISRGKVEQIVASNLREEITADCLKIFVAVAKKCLNLDPKKRPTMSQVVAKLEYAHDQLERRPQTLNAVRFLPFRNRVKISGSRAAESDHKNVDLKAAPQEEESKDEQMLPAARAIPIQELKDVTGNFSSKHLIGEGSSGRVYHGVLKTGQVAAIKKLIYNRLPNRTFLAQVPEATKLKHENVAQLLGHCVDGGQQYLAYEFAQYGSLHDILHGQPDTDGASKPVPSLSWANRVKIAIWAAQGLEYIHHQKQTHCNIKSTNILLFDDYKLAKLADLGRLTPHSYNEAVADDEPPRRPEYLQKTSLRWRTDVYCFGVVLLELLTGGEVVDYRRPTGQHHIVKWATPRLTGDRLKEIVDARLNGDYPPKEVAKMASIAFSCVQYEAQSRPYMSKVVNDLCSL